MAIAMGDAFGWRGKSWAGKPDQTSALAGKPAAQGAPGGLRPPPRTTPGLFDPDEIGRPEAPRR